jgi:hypothetical protein
MITAIVASLISARRWALVELATPQSTAQWEAWRADVRAQQDEASPVRRAVPKSAEPPALVLMRDYFGVCLSGAILFSTVLFWICAWLLRGMLTPVAAAENAALNDTPSPIGSGVREKATHATNER